MKAGSGEHFEQSYNAQAAVDTEGSLLVLGAYVTEAPNDKQQLVPAVASVVVVREVTQVLADTGYFSEAAVAAVESGDGPTAYVAVEKTGHHRTVADLLAVPEPETPTTGPIDRDAMRRRLRTVIGRAAYKKRKETVEPVFGIIKSAMGFRQFLLRGKRNVALEWSLVTLAYNFRRLARLLSVTTTREVGNLMPQVA